MYATVRAMPAGREPDGLGVFWLIPILASMAASVGAAEVTKLISGPSSPKEKDIEAQMKLQAELQAKQAVQQQLAQQQQIQQIGQYALPALAIVALVSILR